MTTECYLLFGFILAGFAGIFWLLARKKEPPKNQSENLFLMLQNQINDITRTLDSRLAESTRLLQGQFGTSTKIIQEVTEKLVKLDETNRQVVNFADQLRNFKKSQTKRDFGRVLSGNCFKKRPSARLLPNAIRFFRRSHS